MRFSPRLAAVAAAAILPIGQPALAAATRYQAEAAAAIQRAIDGGARVNWNDITAGSA